MDEVFARDMYTVIEPLSVVTYFSPESRAAYKEAGLRGYWMGYFAGRAAPLGAAGPGTVEALFHSFNARLVYRALPDAWSFASPQDVLTARWAGVAAALRRLVPDIEKIAEAVTAPLETVVAAADPTGRALFAANRDLPAPADPVARLWQATSALREHRGDGHVALLTADSLNGVEANRLAMAVREGTEQWYRESRGHSEEDWQQATETLRARGFLTEEGTATDTARTFHASLEHRTDTLAAPPYTALTNPHEIREILRPAAQAVTASGELPF
ncbi:SCO6745 family protein [Actinomadura flavalba]|uniref:SCO6745 family protein n=1 Tax=Actinomadura flavalba TaxID=1120938 RepID=UPI0003634256|nr:hypothetical protein [Actinomadura flavalba]